MRKGALIAMLAAGVVLTIGACAYDDYHYSRGYGGYAYDGDAWQGERQPYQGELTGPGVEILDPRRQQHVARIPVRQPHPRSS